MITRYINRRDNLEKLATSGTQGIQRRKGKQQAQNDICIGHQHTLLVKTNKTAKNTTHYLSNATLLKQAQVTQIRRDPSYTQLGKDEPNIVVMGKSSRTSQD